MMLNALKFIRILVIGQIIPVKDRIAHQLFPLGLVAQPNDSGMEVFGLRRTKQIQKQLFSSCELINSLDVDYFFLLLDTL